MEEVKSQNFWTFELGTQEGIKVRIWKIVCLQERERQDSQNFNKYCSDTPTLTSAQCINRTEKSPGSGILLSYDDDEHSQKYSQIKETFGVLTKDDILQPYISDDDSGSSIHGNDIVFKVYVSDMQSRKTSNLFSQLK